ncbi:MAG TPA: class I SAM-dependent methyltransferase [Xanthobacteraceae bacterium]|nr:class I SAM-dependent methyltransferase [Xanthobacteraceae bacterium]
MSIDAFKPCEICGTNAWREAYSGPVRDGAFGKLTRETVVGRCGGCGAERLDEVTAKDDDFYKSVDYRKLLAEPTDAAGFFAEHDILQLKNLEQLWPESLRGRTIADVGCAAGSFLDHVRGLPAKAIAIEPCEEYHDSLKARGYEVYAFAGDAKPAHGTADWAFSFSVIEHVGDAKKFLTDIKSLLKPGGRLLISTPNRADALMQLLPEVYPSFFYRAVHRWYFDDASLRQAARHAGLDVVDVRCVHRFGLSNALIWLRDKKPGGRKPLPHVGTPLLDAVWARALEAEGVGDYLYAILARPK